MISLKGPVDMKSMILDTGQTDRQTHKNNTASAYQTAISQLITNNMSGCFFLKHGVLSLAIGRLTMEFLNKLTTN